MIYTVTFNPAIDYVVRLDSPLQVAAINRATGEDCVLGGKGINVSGVLAQLRVESVALGFIAGETGAWLERGLAAQGLHTDFIHLQEGMTRINVKIKAGQETELNGAGPNIPEAAMQALEAKLDALQKDDVLILAGSIPACLPQTTYERLLAQLQGRGVRAVVDLSLIHIYADAQPIHVVADLGTGISIVLADAAGEDDGVNTTHSSDVAADGLLDLVVQHVAGQLCALVAVPVSYTHLRRTVRGC